jgi:hypothetical protein
MAGKQLKFVIKAVDGFTAPLRKATRAVARFVNSVRKRFLSLRKVFAGLGLAAVGITAALKQSFRFETWNAMFGRIFQSVDKGKEAVRGLVRLAAKTPFTIPGIIETSKQVRVFTDNARGGIQDMIMLGDAAAYTNSNVEEVGFWFGRAYNAIQAGRPLGRAALRLQELGILSAKTRNALEDLGKTKGPEAIQRKMDLLEGDLKRFGGTMDALLGTGDQLWSNLTDIGTWALKMLGDEMAQLAKDKIQKLTDALINLTQNGTLTRWGQAINDSLVAAGQKFKSFAMGAYGSIVAITDAGVWGRWASIVGLNIDIVKARFSGLTDTFKVLRKVLGALLMPINLFFKAAGLAASIAGTLSTRSLKDMKEILAEILGFQISDHDVMGQFDKDLTDSYKVVDKRIAKLKEDLQYALDDFGLVKTDAIDELAHKIQSLFDGINSAVGDYEDPEAPSNGGDGLTGPGPDSDFKNRGLTIGQMYARRNNKIKFNRLSGFGSHGKFRTTSDEIINKMGVDSRMREASRKRMGGLNGATDAYGKIQSLYLMDRESKRLRMLSRMDKNLNTIATNSKGVK